MPKFIDYECENCGYVEEEMFGDTEQQPEALEQKCSECGGALKRGLNVKSNCQIWKQHI